MKRGTERLNIASLSIAALAAFAKAAVKSAATINSRPTGVIGIEGDGEAADIKGDVTQSFSFVGLTGPTTVTGTAHAQRDWIASATGRLGWTWDRAMLYAKGGAVWALTNTQQT
jgi:opacity protein-like surface antigen